jgi:hypothetical protein
VDEFTFCLGGNTIFKVAMDLIVTMATVYVHVYVYIYIYIQFPRGLGNVYFLALLFYSVVTGSFTICVGNFHMLGALYECVSRYSNRSV